MPRKRRPAFAKSRDQRSADEPLLAITGIRVSGFKSVRDACDIKIRPLTILAGANSSGKSSLMQPLLLMKQTLEASYDPGPMRLDGPNVGFSSVSELFTRPHDPNAPSRFSVALTLDARATLTTVFQGLPAGGGLTIPEMNFLTLKDGKERSFRPEMKPKDIVSTLSAGIMKAILDALPSDHKIAMSIQRRRCFLSLSWGFSAESMEPVSLVPFEISPEIPFERALLKLIHLPGLRAAPRAYPTASVGRSFAGTFGPYVASIVSAWQSRDAHKLALLGTGLERLGLAWKVEPRAVDDAHIELYVPRLSKSAKGASRDLVNIADVGVGVSQALPVIVALLTAEPGQMVYIEQPEIHLHPRAQVALAGLLAEAAERGVRIVAETHSSLLLLGIQTLVAEGKLSPDLVKLHWFERDEEGFTKITSTNLDSAGRFETEWPEDFGEVELEAESRYLDASEKRQTGT